MVNCNAMPPSGAPSSARGETPQPPPAPHTRRRSLVATLVLRRSARLALPPPRLPLSSDRRFPAFQFFVRHRGFRMSVQHLQRNILT